MLVFEEMEKKSSRLAITHDVSEVFKTCSPKEAKRVTRLMEGIIAPPHEGIELGMADKLAMRAIEIVSGKSGKEVAAAYRKKGDLGDAAEELLAQRRQHALAKSELSVEKVYDNFYKIAASGGGGSQDHKVKLLAELLSNAEPNEAKIIIRFVTGSLRLGAGESTIIDALSESRSGSKELSDEIERAFNLTSDLGAVAELLFEKGMQAVSAIKPKPFNPIKPALAERLESAQAIIEKIGGGGGSEGGAAGGVRGCSVEGKFDGFRLAVHKKGSRVEFYSRRQERVTHMFPDLAEAFKKQVAADEIICEGEAIGFNDATGTFLPFQDTMQRKRKHGVAEKAEEIPLKLVLFELLYFDGVDYTQKPYRERREKLLKLVKNAGGKGNRIDVAPAVIAKTAAQLQRFFDESVSTGLEGIVAKDLEAEYTAGARKFAWIKLKKSYSEKLADTVDVVVIGYYYGKGKRTEFGLGGLLTAVYDDKHQRFRSVAKIGTGLSEAQMTEFASTLGKIAVKKKPDDVDSVMEPDVWVKPRVVIEVNADEITRSPIHVAAAEKGKGGKGVDETNIGAGGGEGEAEGLALRFPRLVRLRDDKAAEQATTERELIKLFELQRKSRGQSSE